MEDDRSKLIKQALQSGKRYDDVRRELITNGISTEGFKDLYNVAMKELDIDESKPAVSASAFKQIGNVLTGEVAALTETRTLLNRKWIRALAKVILLLAVVIFASGMFWLYGIYQSKGVTDENGSEVEQSSGALGFVDTITEAQMISLQISAQQYKAKLFDYGGLCTSIGIPDDVFCSENVEKYVMESLLSTGQLYCIDSSGFSGVLNVSKSSSLSCE